MLEIAIYGLANATIVDMVFWNSLSGEGKLSVAYTVWHLFWKHDTILIPRMHVIHLCHTKLCLFATYTSTGICFTVVFSNTGSKHRVTVDWPAIGLLVYETSYSMLVADLPARLSCSCWLLMTERDFDHHLFLSCYCKKKMNVHLLGIFIWILVASLHLGYDWIFAKKTRQSW